MKNYEKIGDHTIKKFELVSIVAQLSRQKSEFFIMN